MAPLDQAHLLQKIILLQSLNRTPEEPSERNLLEWTSREDGLFVRTLGLRCEKELAESFAFLTATTDDPSKVVAACVEEARGARCLTVRLAINQGSFDRVRLSFEKTMKILKQVAREYELPIRYRHLQLRAGTYKGKVPLDRNITLFCVRLFS